MAKPTAPLPDQFQRFVFAWFTADICPPMSHSAEFADHFARLTAALVRQGEDQEEQQQYLLSAVTAAKYFPVLLTREGDALLADGGPVSRSTIYTMVLTDRLKGHNVVRLEVSQAPSAADVLGLARILALSPDDGVNVRQRLTAMRAASVRVETAAPPTPTASAAVAPRVSLETFELVSEEQMRSSIAKPPPPSTTTSGEMSGPKAGVTVDQLLKALDDATDAGAIENIVNALVPQVTAALDAGKSDEAVAAVRALARREMRSTYDESRKLIGQTLRRLLTAKLTHAVMKLLPGAGDKLPEYAHVLSYGGDATMEALVDRLTESEQAKERRAIFSVLVQLKTGVPLFIHMLGDRRWFVVRNAADLLAQVGAPEAEEPLIGALHNADPRARRSVITALSRYLSPKSQGSVRRALKDSEPEVRLAAANGIGRTKSNEMTAAVIEAFLKEEDGEVRKAMLGALGRQATEDAVKKLAEAAAPEMLIKRKTSDFRVAAVRALRDAGTPSALQAVKSLATDKDPAVKDAATKLAR
jgi:hypothetical protein